MKFKLLLLIGLILCAPAKAQSITYSTTSGQAVTSSTQIGTTCCMTYQIVPAQPSPLESEADKNKRLLDDYRAQPNYYQNQMTVGRERENMNDAAMKIIQSYVESNGYAWGGFSFMLHCLGLGILGLVGTVAYVNYRKLTK